MAWRGVQSQGRTKWTQQSLTLFSALSAHGAHLLQRSPRRRLVALGEAGRALQADLSLSFLMCRWLYQQPCTASPSKTCSAGALQQADLCTRAAGSCACPTWNDPAALWLAASSLLLSHKKTGSALPHWPKPGLGQGPSAALLNASWTSAGLGFFYSSPVARVSRHTWVPTYHPGPHEIPRAEGTRHFRDPNL